MALDVRQMGFLSYNKCQNLHLKGIMNLHSPSQRDHYKDKKKITLKIYDFLPHLLALKSCNITKPYWEDAWKPRTEVWSLGLYFTDWKKLFSKLCWDHLNSSVPSVFPFGGQVSEWEGELLGICFSSYLLVNIYGISSSILNTPF